MTRGTAEAHRTSYMRGTSQLPLYPALPDDIIIRPVALVRHRCHQPADRPRPARAATDPLPPAADAPAPADEPAYWLEPEKTDGQGFAPAAWTIRSSRKKCHEKNDGQDQHGGPERHCKQPEHHDLLRIGDPTRHRAKTAPDSAALVVAVIRVSSSHPDRAAVARAASVLQRGGLVAFPTETVYGLGANALQESAVARIFAAKGRPSYNPLIIHVADVHGARALATDWPDIAEQCAAAFWPGPLTLVLPKQSRVSHIVSAGLQTVAVRIPAHPVAQALLHAADLPVAAPSANRSTQVSPTTAAHVEKSLGAAVDLILDGGPTRVGIESTVLDVSGRVPVLLRPGGISKEQLEALIGPVTLHQGHNASQARRSPGMLDRHYAPRAEFRLFTGGSEPETVPANTGALLLTSQLAVQHPVDMPADPAEYARRLYAELHRLDDLGCELILVERVPQAPEWAGVRDRLRRAAHRG